MAERPHARSSAARARPCRDGLMPALIFDCDGVLADTERVRPPAGVQPDLRAGVGLPVRWSEDEYGEKLLIGGGKERMASLLTPDFVATNGLPARPRRPARAARRLARAQDRDLQGHGGGRRAAGPARGRAGSSTRRSTPAGRWRSPPRRPSRRCAAFSSTPSGAEQAARFARPRRRRRRRPRSPPPTSTARAGAARGRTGRDAGHRGLAQRPAGRVGAGLRCVVTVNGYTADEDFSEAVLVVTRSATRRRARPRCSPTAAAAGPADYVTLATCEACLEG